jgi:hypothetical protein
LVTFISGPFTFEGKQVALQKDIKANYESFFARAAKTRMWFPDRLKERHEMASYAHFISNETKEILLGFLGVESYVDDYVFGGIQAAGDSLSTRGLYIQWGFEERRHVQTFRHCLIDSGLYSQAFVDKYLAEAGEYQWTFKTQSGYEATPLLAAAYAIFQERQTRWNYTHVRRRIWEEYGSPTNSKGNPVYPAIAGALRFPETDEGAHEANFANIVRIYMEYFPDSALEALVQVSNHYSMPVVQLPNGEEFIKCILAAGMGNARNFMNEIMNPVIQTMGLADRHALRKAVKNFRLLPANAMVHRQGKPIVDIPEDEDIPIYEMLPSGDFMLNTPQVEHGTAAE